MIEPRVWQHKETKKKFKVLPWWECLDPILDDKNAEGFLGCRKFKIGTIVQIGWMLENEHGIWLGTNMTSSTVFKDLGVWKKPKAKKK